MSRLRYNHPTDNLIALATLSLSGLTEQTLYPLTNAQGLNPLNPFKANEKTGRIILDFGVATAVSLVPLIHHNLDAGLSVKWQANATDVWSSPSFSQAFTIGAKDGDGYRPNAYLDLSAAPPNFQFHSLWIEGTNTNDVIPGLYWVGSTIRTLTHNYSDGFRRQDARPGRKQWFTPAGVDWTYASIGRQRRLIGEVESTDVGIAAMSAWQQACGGLDQPTLIIPDAPEITDAVLAKLTVDFEYAHVPVGSGVMPFGFLELARGPAWP